MQKGISVPRDVLERMQALDEQLNINILRMCTKFLLSQTDEHSRLLPKYFVEFEFTLLVFIPSL